MREQRSKSSLARRSFLSRLGVSAAAFGAAFGVAGASAQTTSPSAAPGPPTRHSEDEWLDQTAAKHRLFLDTTTVSGIAGAIFYANNFYTASRTGYSLTDGDSSVVICARHESAPFAFSDAMWVKYGAALAEHAKFTDPNTKGVPSLNVLRSADYKMLQNRGVTLDVVIARGVRLAVCSLATRAVAGVVARESGAKADDIFKELTSNLVPNAHMAPAGIVAVNRAQERGFTFGYVA